MKYLRNILLITALSLSLTACEPGVQSADQKQAKATAVMNAEANNRVGMPGITNYTEKRFAKLIYELRDEAVVTFTYTVALDGSKIFLCDSLGYGLPYAVQYVSPTKHTYSSNRGYFSSPQAEPNGLFMPDSLSATWIQCVQQGKIKVVYVEPEILVSPFKLN